MVSPPSFSLLLLLVLASSSSKLTAVAFAPPANSCTSHINNQRAYCLFSQKQELETSTSARWRSLVAASIFASTVPLLPAQPASAASDGAGAQGISVVTQSELGKSIRGSVVGGAKAIDRLDLKWERFSDSLRDEAKCDPRTNRRMFDNGKRKDGTPIGNPVLGALCTPEPLKELDETTAGVVLQLANDAAQTAMKVDPATVAKRQEQVQQLVGPSFSRSLSTEDPQTAKRQSFNQDLYTDMRALGEFTNSREAARMFETTWGDNMLAKWAPDANRNDYKSLFPKPDDTENQPYDEGALLDALGAVSVALNKLQQGGLIGHWEMSIPEDDYWNVVTIAVDDDISIGGQILAKGRNQPLGGSEVTALVRSAMGNRAKISYKMDTFFIDPTTTKQEEYNPTQLLVSLSDLGQ